MAAAVGHRGNYPKLITLLSGKSRIIEKEYFGWSFLLSFHKNTGQTKIRVSGVSVMCTRIIIKFKQTSVPMVDGCSREQRDEVARGVCRKSASKIHEVNHMASENSPHC